MFSCLSLFFVLKLWSSWFFFFLFLLFYILFLFSSFLHLLSFFVSLSFLPFPVWSCVWLLFQMFPLVLGFVSFVFVCFLPFATFCSSLFCLFRHHSPRFLQNTTQHRAPMFSAARITIAFRHFFNCCHFSVFSFEVEQELNGSKPTLGVRKCVSLSCHTSSVLSFTSQVLTVQFTHVTLSSTSSLFP